MVGNGWQRFATATMCVSLVGFAACSGRNGNGSPSDSATAATSSGEVARPDSAAGMTPAAAAATPSTTPAGTASGTGMMSITGGDAEILQVLAVVDQGEIQDGQLAQRQARNSQVKSFARELVTEHTKSLAKDRQLAKKANVDLSSVIKSGQAAAKSDTSRAATTAMTGAPTGVAGQLETMHAQMMDQLRQVNGAAFDSAFVNAQVMGHQQVLELLQRSGTQAQDSGVKQHVEATIKDVQAHLERGQKLQQSLASAGTSGAGSRADSASGMRSKPDSTSKTRAKSDTGRRG